MQLRQYYEGPYKVPLSPRHYHPTASTSLTGSLAGYSGDAGQTSREAAMLLTFGKEQAVPSESPLLFSFGNNNHHAAF